MNIRLMDGRVVATVNDCACLTHDGPHWLYANDLWRIANQRLYDAGNLQGYLIAEIARLHEKSWYMEREQIEEIIR